MVGAQKITHIVIPANAGIYKLLKLQDFDFTRNDTNSGFGTYKEFIKDIHDENCEKIANHDWL